MTGLSTLLVAHATRKRGHVRAYQARGPHPDGAGVLALLNGELADVAAGTTSVDRFLAGEAFWNRLRTRQDGRSSRAMLRLLQDVRERRSRGLMIDLCGVDSVVRSAREREASMTLNLRTLVANLPYDHVVVLTGRWHARRTPRFRGCGPRPLVSHFHRGGLFLVQASFRAGSSWHCPRRGACGIHDLPTVSGGRLATESTSCPRSSGECAASMQKSCCGQRLPRRRRVRSGRAFVKERRRRP